MAGARWQVAGVRRQAESGKGQDAGLNIHWQVQLSTMVAAAVAVAGATCGAGNGWAVRLMAR